MESDEQPDAATGQLFRSIPNLLTLLRILAIPLVGWLLTYPEPKEAWAAMFIFLFASLTDFLDGWFARRYGLVTALGKLQPSAICAENIASARTWRSLAGISGDSAR